MNISTLAALPMPIKVAAGAGAALLLAGGGAGVTLLATHAAATNQSPAAATSPAPGLGQRPTRTTAPFKAQQAMRDAVLTAAAQALGMDAATLRADIDQGQSLQKLAAGRYPNQETLRAVLLPLVKVNLDLDVSRQVITAEHEQRFMQQLQSGPIPYWTGPARTRTQPSPRA